MKKVKPLLFVLSLLVAILASPLRSFATGAEDTWIFEVILKRVFVNPNNPAAGVNVTPHLVLNHTRGNLTRQIVISSLNQGEFALVTQGNFTSYRLTEAGLARISSMSRFQAFLTGNGPRISQLLGYARPLTDGAPVMARGAFLRFLRGNGLTVAVSLAVLAGSHAFPALIPNAMAGIAGGDAHLAFVASVTNARTSGPFPTNTTSCSACYDELEKITGRPGTMQSRVRIQLYDGSVPMDMSPDDRSRFTAGGFVNVPQNGNMIRTRVRGLSEWAHGVVTTCSAKVGGANNGGGPRVLFPALTGTDAQFLPLKAAVCPNRLPPPPPAPHEQSLITNIWDDLKNWGSSLW